MTLLVRPGFQFDTDASTYIEAVEAADTQALETATRYAINNFVIGCKQDGIWSAIKASCILAGARTLTGALVPLAGTAPTNNNFVSGDYNRKTGLVGNGSTKFLNSGRAGNLDPQSNNHLAVYGTTFPSSFSYYIGRSDLHYGWNANAVFSRNNSATVGSGAFLSSANLVAIARNSSAAFITRAASAQASVASNVSTHLPSEHYVFAANISGSASGHSSARLAFYSIGESLDLAALDGRVTALITAIGAAIP